MREIGRVEIAALLGRRVAGRVEEVGCWAMIIERPFVEVIGDIKCSRIGRGILEVNDYDLKMEKSGQL